MTQPNSSHFTSKSEMVRPNRLNGAIVMSDGIGSAGKRMLGHITASLSGVEKMSHHFVFDYVPMIHWLGKMSDDAAVAYLQTEADLQLYQQALGREVNFRPRDTTSIWANPYPLRYVRRLFLSEGDAVLDRLASHPVALHEATHDGLRSGALFFRAFGERLKIVHIVRDPSDLVLDLLRRGFGQRVGRDPREFQFTLAGPDAPLHVYMPDLGENLGRFSEADMAAVTVARSMACNFGGYLDLTPEHSGRVRITFFDDFCRDPIDEVEALSFFLDRPVTRSTRGVVRREKLPRAIQNRVDQHRDLSSTMSDIGRSALAEAYETFGLFREVAKNAETA